MRPRASTSPKNKNTGEIKKKKQAALQGPAFALLPAAASRLAPRPHADKLLPASRREEPELSPRPTRLRTGGSAAEKAKGSPDIRVMGTLLPAGGP